MRNIAFGVLISILLSPWSWSVDVVADFSATPKKGLTSSREKLALSAETVDIADDVLILSGTWWGDDSPVFFSPAQGSTLPSPLIQGVRYWIHEESEGVSVYVGAAEGQTGASKINLSSVGSGSMTVVRGVVSADVYQYPSSNFNVLEDKVRLFSSNWGNNSEISFNPVGTGVLPSGIDVSKRYFLGGKEDAVYYWRLKSTVDDSVLPVPSILNETPPDGTKITVTSQDRSFSEELYFDESAGLFRLFSRNDTGFFVLNGGWLSGENVKISGDVDLFSGEDYSQNHGDDVFTMEKGQVIFSDFRILENAGNNANIDIGGTPSGEFFAVSKSPSVDLYVRFTDQTIPVPGSSITAWLWDFNNDGSVDSTEKNPTFLFDHPGAFDVKLTVEVTWEGPPQTVTQSVALKESFVQVSDVSSSIVADFTSEVRAGVAPLDVTFLDNTSSTEPMGNLSYYWDFGDGSTSDVSDPEAHEYTNPGLYTVTLKVSCLGVENTKEKKGYVFVAPHINTAISSDYVVRVYPDVNVTLNDESWVWNLHTLEYPVTIEGWNWTITHPDETTTVSPDYTEKSFEFAPTISETDNLCGFYQISVGLMDSAVEEGSTELARLERSDFFRILEPVKIAASPSSNFLRPGQEVFFRNDSVLRTTTDKFSPDMVEFELTGPQGVVGTESIDWSDTEKVSPGFTLMDLGNYTLEVSVTGEVNGTFSKTFSRTFADIVVVGEGFGSGFNVSPSLGIIPMKVSFKDNSFSGEANPPKNWVWEYGDGGSNTWKDSGRLGSLEIVNTTVPVYEMHGPSNNWGENIEKYVFMGNRVGTYSFAGTYSKKGVLSPASYGEDSPKDLPPLSSLDYDPNNHIYSPSYWYKYPGVFDVSLTSGSSKTVKPAALEALPPVDVDFTAEKRISAGDTTVKFRANLVKYVDTNVQYSWEFPGGTPETSEDESPEIVYSVSNSDTEAATEHHDVRLTITTGNWSTTVQKNKYVEIVPRAVGNLGWKIIDETGDPPVYTVEYSPQVLLSNPADQVTNWNLETGEFFEGDVIEIVGENGVTTHDYPTGYACPYLKVSLDSGNTFLDITSSTQWKTPNLNPKASWVKCGDVVISSSFSYTPNKGYAPLTATRNAKFFGWPPPQSYVLFSEDLSLKTFVWGDTGFDRFLNGKDVFTDPGYHWKAILSASFDQAGGVIVYSTDGGEVWVDNPETPVAKFSCVSPARDSSLPTKGEVPFSVKFFDQSVFRGSAARWVWDFGDGGISSDRNPTHVYNRNGSFTVSMTIFLENGKKDTVIRDNYVVVTSPPKAEFSYEVCPNNFVGADTVFLVSNRNKSGVEDGKTWETAYTELQSAVDAAEAVGGGDVWVMGGQYGVISQLTGYVFPSSGVKFDQGLLQSGYSGNTTTLGECGETVSALCVLPGGVNIYGGFDANDMTLDERDYDKNKTVLDALMTGNSHVFVVKGDSRIEGFTILGGGQNPSFEEDQESDCAGITGAGGGVLSVDSNLVIKDCDFLYNSSSTSGGAIAAIHSSLDIRDCGFKGNVGCSGSAVSILDPVSENEDWSNLSSVNVEGCVFEGNKSTASFISSQESLSGVLQGHALRYSLQTSPFITLLSVNPKLSATSLDIDNIVNLGGVAFIYLAGNGSGNTNSMFAAFVDPTRITGVTYKNSDMSDAVIRTTGFSVSDSKGRYEYLTPTYVSDSMCILEFPESVQDMIIESIGVSKVNLNIYCEINGVQSPMTGRPDFSGEILLESPENALVWDQLKCSKPIRLGTPTSSLYRVAGDSEVTDVTTSMVVWGDYSGILDGSHTDVRAFITTDPSSKNPESDLEIEDFEVISNYLAVFTFPDDVQHFDFSTIPVESPNKIMSMAVYFQSTYEESSDPVLSNAVFFSVCEDSGRVFQNTNSYGAIFFDGEVANITNCSFLDNFSSYGGAAIVNSGNMVVESCVFEENTSGIGGAILDCAGVGIIVNNSKFFRNRAAGSFGGAVASIAGSNINKTIVDDFESETGDSASPLSSYKNCLFSGNESNNGSAVGYETGLVRIKHSTFLNNLSYDSLKLEGNPNTVISFWGGGNHSFENGIIWSNLMSNTSSLYYTGTLLTLKDSVIVGGIENLEPANNITNVRTDDPKLVDGYPPYSFVLKDGADTVSLKTGGHLVSEDLKVSTLTINKESGYVKLLRPEWEDGDYVRVYRTDNFGDPLPAGLGTDSWAWLGDKTEYGVRISQDGGYFLPRGVFKQTPYGLTGKYIEGDMVGYSLENGSSNVDFIDYGYGACDLAAYVETIPLNQAVNVDSDTLTIDLSVYGENIDSENPMLILAVDGVNSENDVLPRGLLSNNFVTTAQEVTVGEVSSYRIKDYGNPGNAYKDLAGYGIGEMYVGAVIHSKTYPDRLNFTGNDVIEIPGSSTYMSDGDAVIIYLEKQEAVGRLEDGSYCINSGQVYWLAGKNGDMFNLRSSRDDAESKISFSHDMGRESGTQRIAWCGTNNPVISLGTQLDTLENVIVLKSLSLPTDLDSVYLFLYNGAGRYPAGLDSGVKYRLWRDPAYPTASGEYAFKLVKGNFQDLLIRSDNLVDIVSQGEGSLVVSAVVDENIQMGSDVWPDSDSLPKGGGMPTLSNSVLLNDYAYRDYKYMLPEQKKWSTGDQILFLLPGSEALPKYDASPSPLSLVEGDVYSLGDEKGDQRYGLVKEGVGDLVLVSNGEGVMGSYAFPGRSYVFSSLGSISSENIGEDGNTLILSEPDFDFRGDASDGLRGAIVCFKVEGTPADDPYLMTWSRESGGLGQSYYACQFWILSKEDLEKSATGQDMGSLTRLEDIDVPANTTLWALSDIVTLGANVSVGANGVPSALITKYNKPEGLDTVYFLVPHQNMCGVNYFSDDPLYATPESIGSAKTIRVGLESKRSTPIKLGDLEAGGGCGVGDSGECLEMSDDRWSLGNEVRFVPGPNSVLPEALDFASTYWITYKEAVGSMQHIKVSKAYGSPGVILSGDRGTGYMSMLLVSEGTELVTLEGGNIDFQTSRLRLKNKVWDPYDEFLLTSPSYFSRYPVPLFEGREYQVDGLDYMPTSRLAPLYDYVDPDYPDYLPIDFASEDASNLRIRGEAYLSQSTTGYIYTSPEDVAVGKSLLSESVRADLSDLSSISVGSNEIHLVRENWENGAEVVFNTSSPHTWDEGSVTNASILDLPSKIGEINFPERVKNVHYSQVYGGTVNRVIISGEHSVKKYLVSSSIEHEVFHDIESDSPVNDAVLAPYHKRTFLACTDNDTPFREYNNDTASAVYLGGHDCGGNADSVLRIIPVQCVSAEAIVVTDGWKRELPSLMVVNTVTTGDTGTTLHPESEVRYVFIAGDKDGDQALDNEELSSDDVAALEGAYPVDLGVCFTQSQDKGRVRIFALYSNNIVVEYKYVVQIDSITGIKLGNEGSAYVGYVQQGSVVSGPLTDITVSSQGDAGYFTAVSRKGDVFHRAFYGDAVQSGDLSDGQGYPPLVWGSSWLTGGNE